MYNTLIHIFQSKTLTSTWSPTTCLWDYNTNQNQLGFIIIRSNVIAVCMTISPLLPPASPPQPQTPNDSICEFYQLNFCRKLLEYNIAGDYTWPSAFYWAIDDGILWWPKPFNGTQQHMLTHCGPITACCFIALIAWFMGPTWGPSGADRNQLGPCWPHELCYLGRTWLNLVQVMTCQLFVAKAVSALTLTYF